MAILKSEPDRSHPGTLMFTALVLRLVVGGCAEQHPRSELERRIRAYPEVSHVQSNGGLGSPPTRQLIHILNYHYLPPETFRADLLAADASLSDVEIESEFASFLDEVELLQQEQVQVLRRLITEQGIRHVYLEGLTEENRDRFLESIEQMRAFERNLPAGDSGIELLLLDEHRQQTLLVGAVGRLLLAGDRFEVHAADDEGAYAAANPVADGTVRLDLDAQAKREQRMAERLGADGHNLAVLICGGAHDLGEELNPPGAEVEYIRVTTKKYADLMAE